MAFWDRFRRAPQTTEKNYVVGATKDSDIETLSSFDNSVIAYASQLSAVDYDRLLRDPQRNIWDLMKLAAYYADSDPVVHSIIYNCYLPYTTSCKWYLTGNEKTIKLFEDYYKKIRLRQKIQQICLDYWKYAQSYIYFYEGNIITLPVHKVKISNVTLNGTPIIELNVQNIAVEFKTKTYSVLQNENGIDDNKLEEVLKGYPPQVMQAIKEGKQYAQLDPQNTFVLAAPVQGWQRYAVPWIASCLSALARKEMIQKWQNAQLNVAARPFVHVKYGDIKNNILPDINQLRQVRSIFTSAMSGKAPLAVTNDLASAEIVALDASDIFQWPMYSEVNSSILQAGGISAIISSGQSAVGSSFASAQISVQTVCARIESMQREFEEMMNKLNKRLVEEIRLEHTNNLKEIPQFHFCPLDMSGQKSIQETCQALWQSGVVSTKTFMERSGYSFQKQKLNREEEINTGIDTIFAPRNVNGNMPSNDSMPSSDSNEGGRPQLDDSQRKSAKQNSVTSKEVKDAKNEVL